MNFGMATGTKGQHQPQYRPAWYPMVHDDGSLIPTRSITDAASVAIPLEDCFPQSTEVLFVLSLQRVAGGTQTERKHLRPSTGTVHHALTIHLHFPTPAA